MKGSSKGTSKTHTHTHTHTHTIPRSRTNGLLPGHWSSEARSSVDLAQE